MFKKILIANRGEIACRVIRTAREMGIATVAVHSDADRDALHVKMADEAVLIGPAPAAQSYIVIDRILDALRRTGADAVHPGYGFLSERAEFARALAQAGVAFIGPPVGAIAAMGDKIESKKLAAKAGVSTVPGFLGIIADEDEAARIAAGIGYPVMVKASAGGGGKGMRIAWNEGEAREGFRASKNEAKASFGDDRVFIEKFVTSPRHIEIQVMGDKHGNVVHLFERECSIQRRNQKVIEEAPSPFLDEKTRAAMGAQAVALAKAVDYCSAGTVEFIVDTERNFYFLEMNTRLQVEHPVTELVTGLDLVELMIRVAAGERLPFCQADLKLSGWAIESRLYAEDPYRNFLPSIGRLSRYRPPAEGKRADGATIRNDTGVFEGGEISIHYDPMIAKLCAHGRDRAQAIAAMAEALDGFEVEGVGHNLPFLSAVIDHPRFARGALSTAFIAEEWPDGFAGVTPTKKDAQALASIAACCHFVRELRATRISGVLENHRRSIGKDWLATVAGHEFPLALVRDGEAFEVTHVGEKPVLVDLGGWRPGQTLVRARIGRHAFTVRIANGGEALRLRWRGADLKCFVREPRQAELARLMPPKKAPDTSRLLLCPMPGLVVSIAVREGDEVQEGQALATVEAMKMENILRAEKKARVARVHAKPGDSLAVDAVILEFA
jgi:propionyl-CoA carboxylase alpha chain